MVKKLKSKPSTNSNGGQCSPTKEPVVWSEEMNEYLMDSLLHEQAIGNRKDKGFSSTAYNNIVQGVRDKFGVDIDKHHVKNRLKSVKDNFRECFDLFGQHNGFAWSSETKTWYAEPQVWKEFLEAKPEAKKWTTKTIHHYDKLVELFGKDREKQLAAESPKGRVTWTPSTGFDSGLNGSSEQMGNDDEVMDPDEVVAKKGRFEELDLSEICKTETGLLAIPVSAGASGKGLPYAPVNWPCPGDTWTWRVGCRPSISGHWVDRYLSPPSRFRDATGKKSAFQSRLQVEEYIKREYPDVDPNTFFSQFIWKIPVEGRKTPKGMEQIITLDEPKSGSTDTVGKCKARNKMCRLEREATAELWAAKDCNICCAEAGFCRECCCILCCKTIDSSFGGYSYVQCEAIVEENYICGHVAHITCALRCYMAGTVGGSIGLDVQYYCRRCDNKKDLMNHVNQLIETCESLESRDEIEPILNLGLCILRGSRQMRAKSLEKNLGSAMAKERIPLDAREGNHLVFVHLGNHSSLGYQQFLVIVASRIRDTDLVLSLVDDTGEISQPANGIKVLGAQEVFDENGIMEHTDLVDSFLNHEMNGGLTHSPGYITSDHSNVSVKLEDQVDQVLQELKKSQESEYREAEQRLYYQKDFLLSLYRMLETERAELEDPNPLANGVNNEVLLSNVLNRLDQIKNEEEKFRAMMKVANGFGKTAPSILQEHFGIPAEK